jgi:hypothetical protein
VCGVFTRKGEGSEGGDMACKPLICGRGEGGVYREKCKVMVVYLNRERNTIGRWGGGCTRVFLLQCDDGDISPQCSSKNVSGSGGLNYASNQTHYYPRHQLTAVI